MVLPSAPRSREGSETMHAFEYVAPANVEEALDVLAEHGEDAKVLAGGQSLVPLLNYRLARPRVIVDVNALPLDGVSLAEDRVRIGALTRHATLEDAAGLAGACPLLGEAAALIGNVRVRTLGTLGGSLAHGDPAAELPLAMVALDARVGVARRDGRRTIGAGDFFTGYLRTALAADELVTDVELSPMPHAGWAMEEFSRRAGDFAIVAVAALVRLDGRGRVEDARIALGGVGPTPLRVAAAEDVLRGTEPRAEHIARAADVARDAVRPESDAFVSAAYRRLLAGVLARRALTRAVARAIGG